ncbi:hypothetical protein BHU72_11125 [Desulfuribacillus stibiiarsenatis]|uniref:Spore cortex biosynthesis protein YabQ n=1 Tax=Desulfuribacillus stibiiarsenatis TaxID=1390249 RepID=A0A1E5L338_9FIRM|nr:spore cortex biosynthesis protein YabQ [Desulfuribacillus stibiiarsenatis]OEH84349.1 hypothetical protein BHU72_11125 [Desulfuribacillus stibiiarsenatis]
MDFQAQYQVLLWMTFLGIAMGAIFEAYRVCHSKFKFKRYVLHFLDTCYWVTAALAAFVILYTKAAGEIRVYSLMAIVMGAIIHQYTLRNWTVRITNSIIKIVNTIFKALTWLIMNFIVRPALFLWKVLLFIWLQVQKVWKLLLIIGTTLVGFFLGVVNWIVLRATNLFKKKK